MEAKVFCFLLCLIVHGALGSTYTRKKTYHNDIVATCNGKNDRRVEIMMKDDGVDVWRVHPSGIVEMRMDRALYQSLQKYVTDICYISIQSLEAHVQNAEELSRIHNQKYSHQMVTIQEVDDPNWFDKYHDLKAIYEWYDKLSQEHPQLVKVKQSIGKSYEGRNLKAVHITATTQTSSNRGGTAQSSPHPRFYIQCLIHAREWISGASCMYQAKSLVDGYKTDAKITKLMESMEFVFVPVVNPDGYHYTWTNDRMWRKNRAVSSSSIQSRECVGVDLNRNFPLGWGNHASSCSETYAGTSAASEKETQAITRYYKKNGPFAGAIDFHAFGELILRPYGYVEKGGVDEAEMATVGNELSAIIQKISGEKYISEKSHDLYEAHGIASDWFYSQNANYDHTSLAYTIELRDKGLQGFQLPEDQIKPTCMEVNKAFLHLAEKACERYVRMTTSTFKK